MKSLKFFNFFKLPKYLFRCFFKGLPKITKYDAPQLPRVAFCLSGIVGGVKGKSGDTGNELTSNAILKIGYDHYKKYVFDKNVNVDVFIHTWSVDSEEKIKELYQPKKSIFQKQVIFDVPEFIKGEYKRKQNHYSRWYSTKKVVDLKSQYEKENNFKYDLVFLTRFDIAWQKELDFNKFNPKYFYAADCYQNKPLFGLIPLKYGYPYMSEGLADLWFLSNSSYIDILSTLFDNLGEYNKPGQCPISPSVGISNHKLVSYHLKQKNLIKKLRFAFKHLNPDEVDPLVRKKFFKSKI
jgi:hypothetical protein